MSVLPSQYTLYVGMAQMCLSHFKTSKLTNAVILRLYRWLTEFLECSST